MVRLEDLNKNLPIGFSSQHSSGNDPNLVKLTFDDVYPNAAWIRVAGLTGVDPGVCRHGPLNHQPARRLGSLLRHQTDSTTR